MKCVTVSAPPIENPKRSEVEVNALIELVEVTLLELAEHWWVLGKPYAFLPLMCTWG